MTAGTPPTIERLLRSELEGATKPVAFILDNSLDETRAFQFVRAQRKRRVLFDARAPSHGIAPELRAAATPWLDNVVGPFDERDRRPAR